MTMKSNVPWSVKGIDPEARAVAKEAARRAGMTLGEWMNTMIREAGNDDREEATDPARHAGVSTDQLRAVVDSLNRLHERLRHTEEEVRKTSDTSREAMGGLNTAVETVFERLKRLEKEKEAGAADPALAERVEKLEQSDAEKERIAGLKSLETALSQMVDQFEATRSEALARVEQNEQAIVTLKDRVEILDDKLSAGFEEVNEALDKATADMDRTEKTARAVLLEAREAAESEDADFVERTGKKLQALGNEIKRSGDQISAVEQMVATLVNKIEAAEHRSAEGISEVANELEALRQEILAGAVAGKSGEVAAAFAEATEDAESTVASLQRSYDEIVARLEGRELPPAEEFPAPASEREDDEDTGAADSLRGDGSDEDEFDAVFGAQSEDPTADADADGDASAEGDAGADTPLSPREKILAAARARKERLEKERAALQDTTVIEDPLAEEHVIGDEPAQPRSAFQEGRNRKIGIPLLIGLGVVIAGGVGAATLFLGSDSPADGAETSILEDTPPTIAAPAATTADVAAAETPPERAADAAAVQASPFGTTPQEENGKVLYEEAKALYGNGQSPQNNAEAFRIMNEAATYGYPPARYRLGEFFLEGIGTEPDPRNAKRWFSNAAFSGNAAAMHRLGTLAINPEVDGLNFDEALDWFAKAAELGVVDSMYNLGYLYDPTTDLLPVNMRNAERSYFWYSLAAARDDEIAARDAAAVAPSLSDGRRAEIEEDVANWQPKPLDLTANDGLQLVN